MGRDPEEAGGGQGHSACGVAAVNTHTSDEDGDDDEEDCTALRSICSLLFPNILIRHFSVKSTCTCVDLPGLQKFKKLT